MVLTKEERELRRQREREGKSKEAPQVSGTVKDRTPEERALNISNRQEFIKLREKRAKQLIDVGAGERAARGQAAREILGEGGLGEEGGFDLQKPSALQVREQRAEKRAAQLKQFEEAGVFRQEPLEERELVQPLGIRETVDLALSDEEKRPTGILNFFKKKYQLESLTKEEQDLVLGNPELEEQLGQTLQRKRIDELTDLQITELDIIRGALDVVPFVGGEVSSLLGGSPTKKVQNLKSTLEARKQIASKTVTDVDNGDLTPQQAFDKLNRLERQTNEIEAIIQKEAIISVELRTSSELRDAQTDLLELRDEIQTARVGVAGSVIGEQDPSKTILRLQELKGG